MRFILSQSKDINTVHQLIQNCAADMKSRGILQWDESYPNKKHLEDDITSEAMYSCYDRHILKAVIVMDNQQSSQYNAINWKLTDEPILVVHRLAVEPKYQGEGLGKILMTFAEDFAKEKEFKSIRLDAYKHNPLLQQFYTNLGYSAVGEIALEYTAGPFVCFEKAI